MEVRIEWRSKSEGDDALVAVEEESDKVLETWDVNPELLADFLNDMEAIHPHARNGGDMSQRFPEEWGEFVIARSESGDVLGIDPQLYWEGIAYWFRSRGDDPHPWRRR